MRTKILLRTVLVAMLGALLLLPCAAPTLAGEVGADMFTEGALSVQIDGIPVEFDPAPYLMPPGRTMVPMRAFYEHLGARVAWNGVTQSVTAVRGDRTVTLTIGSRTAYVNGEARQLDVAPEIRLNRTFIPLRFVAESLQSRVYYHAGRQEISISSPNPPVVSLKLEKGMKLHFRLMVVRLMLNHSWDMVIEEVSAFPDPIAYSFVGTLASPSVQVIKRTLTTLKDSRKFMPITIAAEENETVPWVSSAVFHDLKTRGRAENFYMGGFTMGGRIPTTLTLVRESPLVLTMEENRVQVITLEAETATGDRFWILADPENPLVVKFQPIGVPVPGAFGTIGYQIEWVASK